MNNRKAILFSAPSGSGKTTIIKHLSEHYSCFEFSISATSRKPREGENDGVDYYFISHEEFKKKVENDEFLEWEEVYNGICYGTLKTEIERIWEKGNIIVFDVDVNGGKRIKKYFGEDVLSIFVMPPSIEVLEERLRKRGTETDEAIAQRLERSAKELKEASLFDKTIINDDLETAIATAIGVIDEYLEN